MDAEAPSAAEAPCPAPADVSEAPPPSVCADEGMCDGDGPEDDPTSVHSLDALYDMWSAGPRARCALPRASPGLSPSHRPAAAAAAAAARAQASSRSTRCTR